MGHLPDYGRHSRPYTGQLRTGWEADRIEGVLIVRAWGAITQSTMVKRFLLNPSRTSKQGAQINIGKDNAEYEAIVTTLTMHAADMASLGVSAGDKVVVRTEFGEAIFQCEQGNTPQGMLFVPYGPPTCRLMGGNTDGTGMPTSKGWDVEVEPVPAVAPVPGSG